MRRCEDIERLYLDFDGFFASVEQQCDRRLRGRPVGVIPYVGGRRPIIIACSREAKAAGVKNIMPAAEASLLCPDLVLVPQKPDLYRRAHNMLVAEIGSIIPVDAVKSIDELTCKLAPAERPSPAALAARIKRAIRQNVGASLTCSIGFAANRQLAKIAGKIDKPDGLTIWHPSMMPDPLLAVPLEEIPGVGGRMALRLRDCGIADTAALYATQPKQMRAIWRSVNGERLWYALHGYDIEAPSSERGMFGHARVLPPDQRSMPEARGIARLLLIKAARRMRGAGYYCSGIWLWLTQWEGGLSLERSLPQVDDDQALLAALGAMWSEAEQRLGRRAIVARVGVTLADLTPAGSRQLDFLRDDDDVRRKWQAIDKAKDALNRRYAKTVVSIGPWRPPAGGNVGGKIAFTRIPSAEDFW